MNQTAFCNEIIGLMDETRSVIVIYLDFIDAFDSVSHKILIENLVRTRARSFRKLRDWSIPHTRKGCEIWDSREQKLRESQYLQISDICRIKWTGSQALFRVVPVMGRKALYTNWNTGSSLSVSGNTFSLWGWQSWAQAADFMKSPFLEILKSCQNAVLCKRSLGDPACGTGLDQVTSRSLFQPQPFCDFLTPQSI